MLQNNFFHIISKNEVSDNEIITRVKLNTNHKIFKGHFPNNPVVPGVASVQMINEILAEHLQVDFMVSKARSIKFTSMINPIINSILNFNINYSKTEEGKYKVNAKVFFEETIFLKFNGEFIKTISFIP